MESLFAVLPGIALKAALLLATAAFATATMHRRSAAARHMVWALALVSALVLPIVSAVVPVWSISVPHALVPPWAPNPTVSAGAANVAKTYNSTLSNAPGELPQISPPPNTRRGGDVDGFSGFVTSGSAFQSGAKASQSSQSVGWTSSPRPGSSSSPSASLPIWSSLRWPDIVLFVWLAGMLLVASHFVSGAVTARRLLSRATVVTDERWNSLLSLTMAQLWLRRRVVLLQSERVTTPAAWGIFHPVVVVPTAADEWNNVQRHAVLLHELAHVERWDCLTHVLAELACAVYWFNPLAWWAKHMLNTERERACDDRVLGQGTRPSSYAEQLMTVAYSYRGRHRQPAGSLPMAKPSQLEDRVRRILDGALRRGVNTRSTSVRWGWITACFVVSIAAVHPHVPAEHVAVELDPVTQPTTQPVIRPVMQPIVAAVLPDTLASGTNDVHWSGVLPTGDTIAISNLTGSIRAEPAAGNQVEIIAERHSEREDPRTVQIHIERHDHKMLLCSVYPQQLSRNCDSYEFRNNGDGSRGCGGGREQCRSNVEVDWVVHVPANIRLFTSTVAGNIIATGLQSDVSAKSVGGAVDISTAGHAEAWSMSRVNVMMGRTDWTGDLHLYAGSGLTVTLPANADTKVEAISTFGNLKSDFSLQQGNHGSFGTQATGMLGHGGRTLQLRTLGGPIELRNAATAHVAAANDGVNVPRPRASHRSMVHPNADLLGDPPYVPVERASIAAIVHEAIDRADISRTVAASLNAADIPGTVEKAMRSARIGQTVDSAMRAAFGDGVWVDDTLRRSRVANIHRSPPDTYNSR